MTILLVLQQKKYEGFQAVMSIHMFFFPLVHIYIQSLQPSVYAHGDLGDLVIGQRLYLVDSRLLRLRKKLDNNKLEKVET